jgi:16S rRNA (cytosine967-C5)-methyltransferase
VSPTHAPAPTRPDRARGVALDVLGAVLGRPPQRLEEAFARAADAAGLEGRDRAFARRLVATVLRRKGQLDGALKGYLRYAPDALVAQNLLRLGAAQVLLLGTPPHAAVGTSVALARARRRPEAGLINAVLRRIAADEPDLPDVARNLPPWLWRRWCETYGEETARAIATAQAEEPPLDLTVPRERDAWAERLGGKALGPQTVRLEHAGPVEELAGYAEGAWWVQDVAASLPVASLGDLGGRRVLDAGAAPGGKTAQLIHAGAAVTALDADPARMARLEENLARLRVSAATRVATLEEFADDGFDVVLVDAPCTATGTLRRHPDIPWHRSERDVRTQAALQARLLDAAVARLKPSGRLVYASCSLEPEEGETLVADWAAGRGDVEPVPAVVEPPAALGVLARGEGAWRTLPSGIPGGMDGFFFAHMTKRG